MLSILIPCSPSLPWLSWLVRSWLVRSWLVCALQPYPVLCIPINWLAHAPYPYPVLSILIPILCNLFATLSTSFSRHRSEYGRVGQRYWSNAYYGLYIGAFTAIHFFMTYF